MKSLVMKLAIKMAFGKLTPLPWHIEPIVKELVLCACFIGSLLTLIFSLLFILICELIKSNL